MLGETGEPWYEELKAIPRGSTLFHVFAWDEPEALGGTRTKIADIVLNSELHTSLEGDQSLFFRHESISKDRKRWSRAVRRWFSERE